MPTSAGWFVQAAQVQEKAAELHRLAQKLRLSAASVEGSSAQLTQIFDTDSWGGEKAIRTHTNLQGSAQAVRYIASQVTTDADELELRVRQLDSDAEQFEAEGKRQAFVEAEAARQQAVAAAAQAQAAQETVAKAASASSRAAAAANPQAAAITPTQTPALVFAPIESTPSPAPTETQPERATDSYNF